MKDFHFTVPIPLTIFTLFLFKYGIKFENDETNKIIDRGI